MRSEYDLTGRIRFTANARKWRSRAKSLTVVHTSNDFGVTMGKHPLLNQRGLGVTIKPPAFSCGMDETLAMRMARTMIRNLCVCNAWE